MNPFRPLLLLVASLLPAITARADTFVDAARRITKGDSIAIEISAEDGSQILAGARGRMHRNPNTDGTSANGWWIELVDTLSATRLRTSLHWGNENFTLPDERRYVEVAIDSLTADNSPIRLASEKIYSGASLHGEPNDLTLKIANGAIEAHISGEATIFACSAPTGILPNKMLVKANTSVTIEAIWAKTKPDPMAAITPQWTLETLKTRIANSTDPNEAFWRYFDRDCDPKWAQPGGHYTLATVTNDAGGYDIIYIDGAEVNGKKWTAGMAKGRIFPTIFPGNYDLEWVDALGIPVADDISAEILSNSILRLNFPALRSSIRFSRIPLR